MNRKYNIDYFMKKVDEIRKIKKDVSITTDIIAGHPGETEEEFLKVIDNVKKIGFSKLHVFPYSIRKGTPSAKLEQINDNEKKKHTRILLDLSKHLEINYMKQFINRTLPVLIERYKDNYSYGHTTNYLEVIINSKLEPSKIYNVEIKEISYPYCIAEVKND